MRLASTWDAEESPLIVPIGILCKDRLAAMGVELGIAVLFLLMTTIGHANRSYALGRSYGHAFVFWTQQGRTLE